MSCWNGKCKVVVLINVNENLSNKTHGLKTLPHVKSAWSCGFFTRTLWSVVGDCGRCRCGNNNPRSGFTDRLQKEKIQKRWENRLLPGHSYTDSDHSEGLTRKKHIYYKKRKRSNMLGILLRTNYLLNYSLFKRRWRRGDVWPLNLLDMDQTYSSWTSVQVRVRYKPEYSCRNKTDWF